MMDPLEVPIVFASILLNEEKYVRFSLEQHSRFCNKWIMVEGADSRYDARTPTGLSIDRTAAEVERFRVENPQHSKHLEYIQHGLVAGKAELRDVYARRINDYLGDRGAAGAIVVVIDVDEFLCQADLSGLLSHMRCFQASAFEAGGGAVRIPHVHFWRDATQVITGGYWDVPHDRLYWWPRGARYLGDEHNHPQIDGRLLHDRKYERYDRKLIDHTAPPPFHSVKCSSIDAAAWYHFANCKDAAEVDAKNKFYVRRGEAETRPTTTACRAQFFRDDSTIASRGMLLRSWAGPWPEFCFSDRYLEVDPSFARLLKAGTTHTFHQLRRSYTQGIFA